MRSRLECVSRILHVYVKDRLEPAVHRLHHSNRVATCDCSQSRNSVGFMYV